MKYLILKDNYNSFEQFYIDNMNNESANVQFYYGSSAFVRKLFTHYGLPLESLWYGEWKKHLAEYECVIIFDSIHTPNMVRYIRNHFTKQIIFWHWNPLKKKKDIKILEETRKLCEHWTFNPDDAKKYNMKLNNQFFFFQTGKYEPKKTRAFFVGADKGRYPDLFDIGVALEKVGVIADFHIVNQDENDNRKFVEHKYMDYADVLENIENSKIMVEVVQNGQNGLTARTLEAMFFKTKLITNNKQIEHCEFYNKNNIFIWGVDQNNKLQQFVENDFSAIPKEQLYKYSYAGWLDNFDKSEERI